MLKTPLAAATLDSTERSSIQPARTGALSAGRQILLVAVACLLLCAAALVNRQPFFFPDSTAYLRGAELGLTKVLGDRFRTAFSDLNGAAPSTPAKPLSALTPATEPAPTVAAPAVPASGVAGGSLNSPDSKVVIAGRSVYYGALLYLGYVTSGLWLTVAVQALAVAYVLHLLMVRLWRQPPGLFIATVAGLVLLTPLSGFVGLLMPDVFAPLTILATGTLGLYWRRLGKADRFVLGFIVLASLVSHASHVLIASAGLVLLLGAKRWARPSWKPEFAPLILIAVMVACSFGAEMVFNKAVVKAVGEPPLRLPFLMARLIDVGPGTAYLKATCPGSGYTACKWVKNYPTNWEVFMFMADPAKGAFALATPDEKRRISAEQVRFFIDVFKFDPVGVLKSMAAGGAEQLLDFRMHIFRYSDEDYANYSTRLPPPVYQRLQNTVIAGNPAWSTGWEIVSYASAIAGVIACILFALRGGRQAAASNRQGSVTDHRAAELSRLRGFCLYVLAGVVVNALVCGIIASPYDRFQARVIWLVPFIAVALWRASAVGGAFNQSREKVI